MYPRRSCEERYLTAYTAKCRAERNRGEVFVTLTYEENVMATTDTERLNWLEQQEGAGLVSDDAGHWAVVFDGMQNVPINPPQDIDTAFSIEKDQWCKTIREAINKAIAEENQT